MGKFTIPCPVCGKTFETRELGPMWCSVGCQFGLDTGEEDSPPVVTCDVCSRCVGECSRCGGCNGEHAVTATIQSMYLLAANLAIAGFGCEAFGLGYDWRGPRDWHPGCGRPAKKGG